MDFFHKLNQRLAEIAKPEKLNESVGSTSGFLEGSTGDYSAKKARAGKDIGKPGKMFSKIAKSAGERYGSKERGEKVAGAVLAKLRKGAKESVQEASGSANIEKVLDAVAKIYQTQYDGGDEIWEADWMQDWAHTLMQANPTDKELDFIIANGHMPKRLADVEFDVGDDFQFGESALQAYLGKKKYGEQGMKALQKAGREHAGKEKMAKIRSKYDKMDEADMEEGNKFTGNLAKARAAGLKKADLDGDGDMETVRETAKPDYIDLDKDGNRKESMRKAAADAKKKKAISEYDFDDKDDFDHRAKAGDTVKTTKGKLVKTDKGIRHERGYSDEPEADDEKSDAPKKKGRPVGTKRAIGAKGPTGKSKLMSKGAIKEMDGVPLVDKGEYDREGEMAKQQIHTIMRAAKNLHGMLGDDDNLPEWVQKKITLAQNYIDSVSDYMTSQRAEAGDEQPIAEKAVSQQQQKFMGMVHAMQKGEKIKGASPELKKVARTMKPKAAKDFAATKHKGLPKKVEKEEADESAEAPKETKSKGGFEFGKGIYESLDTKFKQALTEGMNISVNMNTGPDGQPSKNITVSADGEDAEALAALLKMAGIGHKDESCDSCGKAPCGCEELDENSPDWPTNTETSDDAMQYSGGLNGPKSTGQTTVPVIASQLRRQVSMEESVELERSLFKLYQNYKAQ